MWRVSVVGVCYPRQLQGVAITKQEWGEMTTLIEWVGQTRAMAGPWHIRVHRKSESDGQEVSRDHRTKRMLRRDGTQFRSRCAAERRRDGEQVSIAGCSWK